MENNVITIVRRREFSERIGNYFTYKADVRIDEKLVIMMREFIVDPTRHADKFVLVDEQPTEGVR